jgi:hypothetical protein
MGNSDLLTLELTASVVYSSFQLCCVLCAYSTVDDMKAWYKVRMYRVVHVRSLMYL